MKKGYKCPPGMEKGEKPTIKKGFKPKDKK